MYIHINKNTWSHEILINFWKMGRNAYTTDETTKEVKSQTKYQKIQQVSKEVICQKEVHNGFLKEVR